MHLSNLSVAYSIHCIYIYLYIHDCNLCIKLEYRYKIIYVTACTLEYTVFYKIFSYYTPFMFICINM